jgi:transposase InsO family protein
MTTASRNPERSNSELPMEPENKKFSLQWGTVDRRQQPIARGSGSAFKTAERFIQTCRREWAYGAYNTSDERAAELPRWLHRYNWRQPHGSIGAKPPSRLGLTGNKLLRLRS